MRPNMNINLISSWVLTLSPEETQIVIKALQGELDEPSRQEALSLVKEIKHQVDLLENDYYKTK